MSGRPLFFDINIYLSVVEMMINADEIERALWMLDNPPAFYREKANRPARLKEIKDKLNKATWTPVQYKGIYKDVEITAAHTEAHWPLRARLLEEEIKRLNDMRISPTLMELAPGGKWLEAGLRHKACGFNYECMSLDGSTLEPDVKTVFNIFIAFELIEHLSNENEIYQNYLKFNRHADIVMLSTPLYTWRGGMPNWEQRELGHLRTYTPDEFHDKASQMFEGYSWDAKIGDANDGTIVLTGKYTG